MSDPVEYDKFGRMKYHPDFHDNQGKEYSIEELEYICKYYEHDEVATLSLAVGRTSASITDIVRRLKREGLYNAYKNMNRHY